MTAYIYQESENPVAQAKGGYVDSESATGRWSTGEDRKVTAENRSKTIPKWKSVQLQGRHLVVKHPNVGATSRTEAGSSEEKQRFAAAESKPEVRECRHTYTHEGFQAFCFWF